jgi:hypothetical protein
MASPGQARLRLRVDMGTLKGFPNPPAIVRQSQPEPGGTPHYRRWPSRRRGHSERRRRRRWRATRPCAPTHHIASLHRRAEASARTGRCTRGVCTADMVSKTQQVRWPSRCERGCSGDTFASTGSLGSKTTRRALQDSRFVPQVFMLGSARASQPNSAQGARACESLWQVSRPS